VDNFHTGYVLESLSVCARRVDTAAALACGLDYWERELFTPDGVPKYTPSSLYPIDAHCFATAIDTWVAVAPYRTGALERARRTANLLMENFLLSDGHVRFQRRRRWDNDVPFVRWTTAPAFRALARLVRAERE
jgi:hypothetical protein